MTLQEQAEQIITGLGLASKLGQFGEVHVVGSVAFGTTVKPDIDIQIYARGHYEDVAAEIIKILAELGVNEIHGRRLRKSKKYLILSKIQMDAETWDLDITLTQPDKKYIRDSYQYFLDYKPKMTDEKRELIMRFKQEFANLKISGDNPAFYIYNGVLDNDITTHDQMAEYLSKVKK